MTLGCHTQDPGSLVGGSSVESSAAIALAILEGRGTPAQEEVVVANAGMALLWRRPWNAIRRPVSSWPANRSGPGVL
jgi:anthranilate phosphoribosyltransferase